jgi:hypothetical protein
MRLDDEYRGNRQQGREKGPPETKREGCPQQFRKAGAIEYYFLYHDVFEAKSSQGSEERDERDGEIQGPELRRTQISGHPHTDNNSKPHPYNAIKHQPACITKNILEARGYSPADFAEGFANAVSAQTSSFLRLRHARLGLCL